MAIVNSMQMILQACALRGSGRNEKNNEYGNCRRIRGRWQCKKWVVGGCLQKNLNKLKTISFLHKFKFKKSNQFEIKFEIKFEIEFWLGKHKYPPYISPSGAMIQSIIKGFGCGRGASFRPKYNLNWERSIDP